MQKTAVIILNWNGKKYLKDCLSALTRQDYPKNDREFILIDNASTDDSVKYAKENYPEITIIKNDKNYGFAKGNNIGMKYALDKGYEYAVLLNQDTAVKENWLSELVKAAESDKKIGAVQSLIMHFAEKNIINSRGNQLHFLGFGFCGGNNTILRIDASSQDLASTGESEKNFNADRSRIATQNNAEIKKEDEIVLDLFSIRDISYASGASMLLRTSVLKEIGGGFDEEYFLYHEDTDLSFRIKMAGYRVVLAPKSVMYHKYEFSKSIKKFYYMERNRYRILLIYDKWPTLILIFPVFLAMELGMWLFALKGGWGKEKLRAYGYMLNPRNLADIFKKRRYIQKTRKLDDREFTKSFVGEIMYKEIDNPLLRYIVNPIFKVYWKIVQEVIFW